MRLRNVKNKEEIMNSSSLLVRDEAKYKENWKSLFNNDNPIYIEIGMGKGDFIIGNALNNPNINYIGIEKYDSVMARAIEKIKDDIPNLRLVRMDAKDIENVFYKEVDRVYLNFSDPWPKKRHAERRLTSNTFLKKYDSIFRNNMEIQMKTDNISLFEFSLVSLSNYGYVLKEVSLDLHSLQKEDNVMTEYERKFSSMGVRINYLAATKKLYNLQKKC